MASHLVFDLDKLHERVDEVNPINAQKTVSELRVKLKKYPDLIALSAPQIGIAERVIAIKFNNNVIKEYINPVVLKSDGLHLVREKDISIAEKEFIIPRPNKLYIRYQTEYAKPEENILKDSVAEIFDRMMNYLDGITMDDIGLEVLPEFDEATDEEKQEIIDMYLKSLKDREELLQDNINEDKDAKELQDAIKFMAAVEEGKVELADKSILIQHDKDAENI